MKNKLTIDEVLVAYKINKISLYEAKVVLEKLYFEKTLKDKKLKLALKTLKIKNEKEIK